MSYEILKQKLNEFISLENSESVENIASFIVGEFLGDYDDKYGGLYDNDSNLQQIADLASDLEISNGNEKELAAMWAQLKERVKALK